MSDHELSNQEVAELLQGFIDGTGGPWDWDNFTCGMKFADRRLQEIQARCRGLSFEFAPSKKEMYTNEQGTQVIRDYIIELRRT
jgi:hypothetical protein